MGGVAPLDITGKRYGRLIALCRTKKPVRNWYWLCYCDCGNIVEIRVGNLQSGTTNSCGCLNAETRYKHGHSRCNKEFSPTYVSWACMKQRCLNPKNIGYYLYGGRGIPICESWKSDFLNFLADMGERPFGKTLDRIDNNGNYTLDNCAWATPLEQIHNRRI